MRAWWLAIVLLLPLGAASPPTGDLIVVGTAPAPPGAIPLSVIDGFVVPDATAALARALAATPGVERVAWAQPLEPHAAPVRSDTLLGLTRAQTLPDDAGAGVGVAVLDTGIDATHPDLAGRVRANLRLAEGRFVPSVGDLDGHGTHVAGVLAASGASSQGRWRGVAPGVHLVGLDISSRFTTASALLAYDWIYLHHEEYGLRVVVNAWGRIPDGDAYDPRDPTIRAIERVVDEGVVVVFSASNRGPAPGSVSIEAQSPRVLTVGATDAAGLVMPYSARGPAAGGATKPDVVAPGDAVVGLRSAQTAPAAADPDALHRAYSGTSQAAPHVAGIVAAMLARSPDLTPEEVGDMLRASAVDVGAQGIDDASGAGLVDAADAMRLARGDAALRDNVLLAGGIDEQRDASPLAPTSRRLLGLLAQPALLWETSFAVKPGAESLEIAARVEGASDLRFEAGRGDATEISWRGESTRAQSPAPGVWTLRAYGALPVAADGEALARVTLPPQPERALEPVGAPERADAPGAATSALLVVPAFLVGLGLALLAPALRRRRAQDPYLEAGAPSTRDR